MAVTEQEAYDWVCRYADGGKLCGDCRYSQPVDPGDWSHICKVAEGGGPGWVLNSTDCPALPEEMYPDPEEVKPE